MAVHLQQPPALIYADLRNTRVLCISRLRSPLAFGHSS